MPVIPSKNAVLFIVATVGFSGPFVTSNAIAAPTPKPASAAVSPEAKRPFRDEFREAGLRVPQALQKLHYKEFGDLNLKTFIENIRKVQVIETRGWKVGDDNGDGRISARWERHAENLTVTVDLDMWDRFPEQRANLALHEYLGALGFQDRNYWLSTELWTLSLPEAQAKLRAKEKQAIARRISQQTRIRFAGGVIGVGGGGELATLWVRTDRVIKDLAKLKQNAAGQERSDALVELGSDLEGNVTVSYMTPKLREKAEREGRKKVDTACLTEKGTCTLPRRRFGTGSNECRCEYADPSLGFIEGTVIYPQ